MAYAGITTPQRITEFLAQLLHESGGLSANKETMIYTTPGRANAMFGVFSSDQDVIDYYNNVLFQGHPAGWYKDSAHWTGDIQKQFANHVYATKNGNHANTDDGWNFRGRGPIQLTARNNYQDFADYIDSLPGIDGQLTGR